MGGLSRRNLFTMRNYAEWFPDGPIVQQPVAQLPRGYVDVITHSRPEELRSSLPTIEEIEAELSADLPNDPEINS
jgi:hypothetical protein